MNSHILIAGGAGFIGSHLCEHYLNAGRRVVCVDNLSTGRRKNIAHLEEHPDFIFAEADICDGLPTDIADKRYDLVINLASPASPPHYQRLALQTLRVGSQGTYNLLEIARRWQARFLQASTSEVYGDPTVSPQAEHYYGNVNCYGPRAMYDEAKRYGEALVYVYRQKYGLPTAVARIFNTYGPRMDPDDGRVVSNFITEALQDRPITVYGKGQQTRSFCYITDLLSGLVALAASDEPGPMNLGNPSEYTVLSLAQTVMHMIETSSTIEYSSLPQDDPLQRRPNIEYAKNSLNWQPQVSLQEGLEKTIVYFRTELSDTSEKIVNNENRPLAIR